MSQPLPCPSCGGYPVVSLERFGDRAEAYGSVSFCPECNGANVVACSFRLVCRGVPATRMTFDGPICEGCADDLRRDEEPDAADACEACGDGQPVAVLGELAVCDRCVSAIREAS